MKILNPNLERTIEEGKISLSKILWTIISLPVGSLWLIIFTPFVKGKVWVYRRFKNLGNVWEDW